MELSVILHCTQNYECLVSMDYKIRTTECPTSTPLHSIERSSAPFEFLQGHEEHKINLPIQSWNNRGQVKIKLNKTQTERRTDFVYRTAKVVSRLHDKVDFNREIGLKNRIINLMWWHVENLFFENKVCTWQLCCDCGSRRNNWTNFWTDSGGTGPSSDNSIGMFQFFLKAKWNYQ